MYWFPFPIRIRYRPCCRRRFTLPSFITAKVTLLHIVTVPSPTPLSSGYRYLEASDSLREQAISMVRTEGVAVEYIVRVARRVAPAIIDTAHEQRADLVVIGWQGVRDMQGRTVFGSNIDQVLGEINCDVMMLQPGNTGEVKRVLMPIADPRQVGYSLQLIQLFASTPDMVLDLMHIFSAETPAAEQERFTRTLQRQIEAMKVEDRQVNLITDVSSDRIDAIVRAARDYDYVALGETRDTRVKQRLFGNTSMRIAERTQAPVVLLHPEKSPLQLACNKPLTMCAEAMRRWIRSRASAWKSKVTFVEGELETNGKLKSSVNQPLFLLIGALTLIAAMMMFAGDGGTLTWIGVLIYFGSLLVFTFVSVRAARSPA